MKYKKFDVVELKNNNRATILQYDGKNYIAEVVNAYGITLGNQTISNKDITKIVYSKEENNIR